MDEPLRILLVDDEDLARLRLRSLAEQCTAPRALVVGEAGNATQAQHWLAAQRCDLVLLDIHMPGADGMQLAAEIKRRADAPAVVFVTAHAEHALQAFDLEAVDYLTKPVRADRLQSALQRVALRRTTSAAEPAPGTPTIVVTDRGRVVRVPVSDVLYLKAELKYVTLRTAAHTYVLDEALSELEARIGAGFLRVHRNALVALRAVRALERRELADGDEPGAEPGGETWAVQVAPVGEWLAVSRRQVGAVRDALVAAGL